MSFWARLLDYVGETASASFASVVEAVRTLFEGDPETRRRVAFSVAMVALSAKMAKADGIVTLDEVAAFREIFEIPQAEADNVARLYNLAKQDVAGFEAYAERLAALCGSGERNCAILRDILDGLFHIAKADGMLHEKELAFLARVAEIFGIEEAEFDRIAARHVRPAGVDPYAVLGLPADADLSTVKQRYRSLVSETHPDRLLARGVPPEFLAIANDRMAALNAAYEAIEKERRAA
jgi:DnaJ like chaperone protein